MPSNTPPNLFKKALQARQPQIGLWLGLADAYASEVCATAGFDWLLIDGEHAPNDLRTTLAALQAIAPYPSHPVVRVPEGSTTLLKQVLELGANTVLVPMVETAEQARSLVRAVRYPPAGVRGVGSGLARSSRWGQRSDYLLTANDNTCLLLQVETQEALTQLEAIASVDGVDGVFIGPADLSASMGHLGQTDHPAVRAAIEGTLATIHACGKASGILCTDEALARHYLALGASFVAVGVDATVLANACRQLAGRFRSTAAVPAPSGY